MPLPLQDTPADTSYHQILELLRMQQSAVPEGSPNGWDNRAESQDTPDSRSQLFSPVSSSYSSLVALGISTPVSPSALSFTNFYALQVSPPEPAFVFGTEASPATAPVAGLGNVADHTTTTPLVTSPTELNRASSSPNHNTPAPVADARSISADPLLLFGQGSPRSSNHNVSRESSQGAAAELIDPALAAAGSNRGFAAGTNGTRTLLRRSRGARARRQPPRQTRRSSAGAFSPQAQRALRALLFNIRDNPYPDDETIRGLEGEYRLSTKQIRNWFALRRHRHMVRPEIPGIQAWRLRDDSNP
ncbi:hypothetical protein GGF46_003001 [Coemansia sp. RSA 552]|nr:hypothetical protein GGF46_003001 [Coemansia sp. RSA 552]